MNKESRIGGKRSTVTRCPYCLEPAAGPLTREHIIARSWFPERTPASKEKWQVPVCEPCNRRKSRIERRALVLLATTIDPNKPGAAGILQRALNSLNAGRGRTATDAAHRHKLLEWLLSQVYEATPDDAANAVPFTRRNLEMGGKHAIRMETVELEQLIERWVRGFHFYLTGRFIEAPSKIRIVIAPDVAEDPGMLKLRHATKELRCGRGMLIRQVSAERDGKFIAIYFFKIWNQITAYGFVSSDPSDFPTATSRLGFDSAAS